MTRSRIFVTGTLEDPVVLSNSENNPEALQEVDPKEESIVINQPPTIAGTLLVLLVVQLALSLQHN